MGGWCGKFSNYMGQKKLFVAFPWVETSTGPGGFMICVFINMTGTRERSGSVVERLTQDRRAVGSSLTGVTALWSLSKTHLS